MIIMYYFAFRDDGGSGSPPAAETFTQVIEQINTFPQFFQDALNWGIDASFMAMGFLCVLVLGVSMFKR